MSQKQSISPGTLYVVATPIGHLDDLTMRAREILSGVDRVCCEDTRHSARLMDHLGLSPKMTSLHEHNEREKSATIVQWLKDGEAIALISDAGTPLISDPGYILVNEAVSAGARIVPVPGVSAVTTALSISGLPTDHFAFDGFLPAKSSARKAVMEAVAKSTHTRVFYESSHRIADSLQDMVAVFGADRPAAVCRELTKTFETVLRGSLGEIADQVSGDSNQRKGEFVVLVRGVDKAVRTEIPPEAVRLMEILSSELPPKKLASAMADVYGGGKKLYYDHLLAQREK